MDWRATSSGARHLYIHIPFCHRRCSYCDFNTYANMEDRIEAYVDALCAELASLPGEYAPPRGALLLALIDGQVAGCCALRPLDTADYPNAAEMKRLYVRKAFRRFGLGRQLAEATLDAARVSGYHSVLLDTLDDMEAARQLYAELGFEEVAPYYHNPLPGAHYLKVDL